MVFAGIVIINAILADLVIENILLRPVPQSFDLTQELVWIGYSIVGSLIVLGFLIYETSKAYNFLLKSESDSSTHSESR